MGTSLKQIIDVEPVKGMTREKAINAAIRTASKNVTTEYPEIEVEDIRPIASRLKSEEDGSKIWQVVAEVIEKESDFPPSKDDDDSDSGDGDLPKKLDDIVSPDDDKETDDDDPAAALNDVIGQLKDIVKQLGGKDDEDSDLKDPSMDDPMGGPPLPPAPKPKPPFMSKVLELPKNIEERKGKTSTFHTVSRDEALSSARALPRSDRELRGYKLASLDETETHFVAKFTR